MWKISTETCCSFVLFQSFPQPLTPLPLTVVWVPLDWHLTAVLPTAMSCLVYLSYLISARSLWQGRTVRRFRERIRHWGKQREKKWKILGRMRGLVWEERRDWGSKRARLKEGERERARLKRPMTWYTGRHKSTSYKRISPFFLGPFFCNSIPMLSQLALWSPCYMVVASTRLSENKTFLWRTLGECCTPSPHPQ